MSPLVLVDAPKQRAIAPELSIVSMGGELLYADGSFVLSLALRSADK